MIQFAYTKEKLVKFMRDRNYLKEVLSISKDRQIYLLLEKNTGKMSKYMVTVQLWNQFVWQKSGNNSEDLANYLHPFLVKNDLIPKETPMDPLGWIRDNLSSIFWGGEKKTESVQQTIPMKVQKPIPKETGKSEPWIRPKKQWEAEEKEILQKKLGEIFGKGYRNNWIETFHTKGKILLFSEANGKLGVFEDTIPFWKELIIAYLMALPERVKQGFEVPEYVGVTYNTDKVIKIYIHNFLDTASGKVEQAMEAFDPKEEDRPFSLCSEEEDYYISRPSLTCWIEDLFRSLGVKEVQSLVG
ncbi:MAG: hypothetical protein ACD_71C00179G0002 [uncultured bacterium (gcode 4)]|uniref:Uncharacterized protein n=1 Tax=uncultured bacterium (gcode 4) TaxID=1234023 RepID=K1Z444_9BACT|nr:MAG: hypothetical protein ACD_71C00179G0002 [uncultured bacterium (gcode 4)]